MASAGYYLNDMMFAWTMYTLIGASWEDVRPLHDVTVDIRDRIPADQELQKQLFNDGYRMERYFESFWEIRGPVIPRNMVVTQFNYTSHIMKLAQTPPLEAGTVAIPGEEKDLYGIPIETHKALHKQWIEDIKLQRASHDYLSSLEAAADEFNLQFVLCRIHASMQEGIRERVSGIPQSAFGHLDGAYYNAGKRKATLCTAPYQGLAKLDERFVLDVETTRRLAVVGQ